jgi:hypothetical protein
LPFTVIETVVVAIEASIFRRVHDVPDRFIRFFVTVADGQSVNPKFFKNHLVNRSKPPVTSNVKRPWTH